jgi:hypothetical protein
LEVTRRSSHSGGFDAHNRSFHLGNRNIPVDPRPFAPQCGAGILQRPFCASEIDVLGTLGGIGEHRHFGSRDFHESTGYIDDVAVGRAIDVFQEAWPQTNHRRLMAGKHSQIALATGKDHRLDHFVDYRPIRRNHRKLKL